MQEPQFTISDKIIKFPEFSLIALQSNFHIFQQFRFGPKFLENLGMHLYSKLLTHNSPYLITEVRVLSSKNVLEDLQQGLSSKTGHQGRTSNSASNWSFLAEFPRSIFVHFLPKRSSPTACTNLAHWPKIFGIDPLSSSPKN